MAVGFADSWAGSWAGAGVGRSRAGRDFAEEDIVCALRAVMVHPPDHDLHRWAVQVLRSVGWSDEDLADFRRRAPHGEAR
jgi:hypothetical protein